MTSLDTKKEKKHPRSETPSLPVCDLDSQAFREIFDTSPIGIYVAQDRNFCYINPEFERICGYERGELLGKDALSLVDPRDTESVRQKAVKMLKGESTKPYVLRVVRKDGDIRWIIEKVAAVQYRGKRATLGYFMDNTEHELAKEALALSEEKFQKAFRSSPDWFVISTLGDGFYVDVNEAFLQTTGYRREEVIGHTSAELGIWADPEERAKMVETLRRLGIVRNMEVRFRMRSGEIRHVLWSAEVIDYGDEKCLLAITRDITSRKRAEEERAQRERVQGVLELAGAACHELNQPLQYIYYILDEIREENPNSKVIPELKKQCDRLREITGKLEGITTYQTRDYIRGSKIIDIHQASKK
jgi:PAS domain S-box-containing protein